MKHGHRWIGWLVLMTGLATPALAQYQGQTAVGLGTALVLPTESEIDLGYALLGNIEYYLSHRWSVGMDFGLNWSSQEGQQLRHAYLGLQFGLHFDLGKWHPMFLGGVHLYRVREKPGPKHDFRSETSIGAHFGVGLEYFFQPTFSVRWTLLGHDVFSDLKASYFSLGVLTRFYF